MSLVIIFLEAVLLDHSLVCLVTLSVTGNVIGLK